jgi:hypothetical protein
MKTLILEVDDAVYPKIQQFLELLPQHLCQQINEETLNLEERQDLESIRTTYRSGSVEDFDDWSDVRETL